MDNINKPMNSSMPGSAISSISDLLNKQKQVYDSEKIQDINTPTRGEYYLNKKVQEEIKNAIRESFAAPLTKGQAPLVNAATPNVSSTSGSSVNLATNQSTASEQSLANKPVPEVPGTTPSESFTSTIEQS